MKLGRKKWVGSCLVIPGQRLQNGPWERSVNLSHEPGQNSSGNQAPGRELQAVGFAYGMASPQAAGGSGSKENVTSLEESTSCCDSLAPWSSVAAKAGG